jgi:hypothetical protein
MKKTSKYILIAVFSLLGATSGFYISVFSIIDRQGGDLGIIYKGLALSPMSGMPFWPSALLFCSSLQYAAHFASLGWMLAGGSPKYFLISITIHILLIAPVIYFYPVRFASKSATTMRVTGSGGSLYAGPAWILDRESSLAHCEIN